MKKIYFLGAMCAAFLGLSSCNETWDDAPVLKTHEGVQTAIFLNEPSMQSAQLMITPENKTHNLNFTCSQPDYGYAAAAAYQVQMSLTQDFADYREIAQRFYDCAQINPLYSDITVALEELAGIKSVDELPMPFTKVYFRVKAFIPQSPENTTFISNVVYYDAISANYLDVWVPGVPVDIYLRGGLPLAEGWEAVPAYQFVQGDTKDTWVLNDVTIPSGTEFKVADSSWGDVNLGVDSSILPGTSYKLQGGGANMKMGANFTGSVDLVLSDGVYTMTLVAD